MWCPWNNIFTCFNGKWYTIFWQIYSKVWLHHRNDIGTPTETCVGIPHFSTVIVIALRLHRTESLGPPESERENVFMSVNVYPYEQCSVSASTSYKHKEFCRTTNTGTYDFSWEPDCPISIIFLPFARWRLTTREAIVKKWCLWDHLENRLVYHFTWNVGSRWTPRCCWSNWRQPTRATSYIKKPAKVTGHAAIWIFPFFEIMLALSVTKILTQLKHVS